ncbi:DUF2878 domain-containing protein [Marinomonas algarum]|uniref:DUF2878 domain-containing protein n=1 Tax=Marinomonas algarum TaxID=2883105 RepID=A0A9X1LF37_9GAMM|nr:DUF2878 domain-containing protein [Marinomonas algarum]MCB5162551.1 DUF2878 domain-containing protein [Marinomonas algarum]
MMRLANAILFQLVWFICLLFGSAWALAATAVYLFLHDRYFMRTRREWRLVCVFLCLGFIIDGVFFQLGLFSIANADPDAFKLPPIWLLCLWVSVATMFAHSLDFLRSRYVLGAVMGMIGPPMSYFAGAKLAGITLAEPTILSLFAVGAMWMLVLPIGIRLSEKWALFSLQGAK